MHNIIWVKLRSSVYSKQTPLLEWFLDVFAEFHVAASLRQAADRWLSTTPLRPAHAELGFFTFHLRLSGAWLGDFGRWR